MKDHQGVSLRPSRIVFSCPNCKRQRMALFAKYEHLQIELNYDICGYCGFVFMNPQFTETDLASFYQSEYREQYSGQAEPTLNEQNEQLARATHLTSIVAAQVGEIDSHLDIGCSTGVLIRQIEEKLSIGTAIGVEPSDAHRNWCAERNTTTYPSLECVPKESGRFDLITLVHVLEHVPDPVAYLKRLRSEYLTADGYLLVEVPNLFGHISFEIAHLWCFYEKTILEMLHQSGFEEQFLTVHGIPRRYENSQRYITVVAVPQVNAQEDVAIQRVWWRWVYLLRLKGLTKRGWVGFMFSRILQTIRHFGK